MYIGGYIGIMEKKMEATRDYIGNKISRSLRTSQ